MTADEIIDAIKPHLRDFDLIRIEVKPYDGPPMDTLPVADVFVQLGGARRDLVADMGRAAKAMSMAFGCEVRAGYYDAAIGYDDVPAGQAMLEFDGLPFVLDPTPTRSP